MPAFSADGSVEYTAVEHMLLCRHVAELKNALVTTQTRLAQETMGAQRLQDELVRLQKEFDKVTAVLDPSNDAFGGNGNNTSVPTKKIYVPPPERSSHLRKTSNTGKGKITEGKRNS